MSNPDYPDPCEYCSLSYLVNAPRNCREDCEELKEAARQWAKEPHARESEG